MWVADSADGADAADRPVPICPGIVWVTLNPLLLPARCSLHPSRYHTNMKTARSIACLVALTLTAQGGAQGPPPGTPPGEPIGDAAVAESLAVLRQLDSAVRAKPRDPITWHHRAMVAWSLMYRARVGPPYKGLDWTLLGRAADSSMRIALNLGARNPRIELSAAQFYLGSGQSAMRLQSYRHFSAALDLARKGPDQALLAEALIEQGRVYWRRYDTFANRRIEPDAGGFIRSLASDSSRLAGALGAGAPMTLSVSEVVTRLNLATLPLPADLMGAGDYERAEQLFREAFAASPGDARVFHQLAMVFAAKKRWTELATLSRDRLRRSPNDARALLALGVAMQRTRKVDAARAAFDSALAALDPRARSHLTSMQRVIPTQDEARFARLTTTEREREALRYWTLADPLWSRGGSDAYTEFLARAAYADIRWTVEELGVRGVDSDRGMIHVRYGPPDVEAVLGPAPARGDIGDTLASPGTARFGSSNSPGFNTPRPTGVNEIAALANLTTLWAYSPGWLIIFRGAPTYATARIPPEDIAIVDSLVRATPASWRNATEETIIDMPTQVARFRGPRDSVDVVIASEPPVAEMREMTGANTLVRTDLWLFGRDVPNAVHDSSSIRTAGARTWKYRVPRGIYEYRVESTADGALLAGRWADRVDATADQQTGFATRGFGISDVLLAGTATPRAGATRWSDIEVAPTAGTVTKGGQLALVWEEYEFGEADGSAKYSVSVSIERRYKQAINRLRARVISAFAAMAGVERSDDRVVFRYERSVPYSPTMVDYLTIGLDDSSAGEYRLTLDITDRVTGRTSTRTQRIVIRE